MRRPYPAIAITHTLTEPNSQKFCGIARMTSPMDWNTTDEDWLPRADGEEYQG